jgi:DNA-binding NtrC family response regulator
MPVKKKEKTILVVDEDEPERASICRILEGQGYTTITANNYWDALRAHDQYQGRVDMLLTAIALPGNNGYELARSMTAADPALKVLYASGPTGAEISRFYNMPTAGPHLVEKPVRAPDLVSRVSRVFRSRARQLRVQRAS